MMEERDIIKRKLEELEAPIDKELNWGAIEAKTSVGRGRKRRGVFFLLLLLVALVGGLLWISVSKVDDSIPDPLANTEDQKHAISAEKEETVKQSDPAAVEKNNTVIVTKSIEEAISTEKQQEEAIPEVNQVIPPINESSRTVAKENRVENDRAVAAQSTVSAASNVPDAQPLVEAEKKLSIQESEATDAPLVNVVAPSIETTTAASDLKQTIEPVSTFAASDLKQTIEPVSNTTDSLFVEGLARNTIGPIEDSSMEGSAPIDTDLQLLLPQLANQRKWRIEFGAGVGYGKHVFDELASTPTDTLYQNNIATQETYHADLRLQRAFGQKWRLSLGLQYSTAFQLFNYEVSDKSYEFRPSNSGYYQEIEEVTTYSLYQRHHFADANLMLFRDFNFGKNSLFVGAGLSANLSYQANGSKLGLDGKLVDINADNRYRTNVGLRPNIEVGYAREIAEKWIFSASLSMQTKQQLQTTAGSHTFMPVNLRVGVGYRF